MIEFKTFDQALSYQPICPLCLHRNQIDRREACVKSNHDYGAPRSVIYWANSDNELSIDMGTSAVISLRLTQHRNIAPIYSIGGTAPVTYIPSHSRSGMTASGHLMERMIVGCENCYQYDYVVQVIVKVDEKPPSVRLLLNSESLTLDEKGTTHEIRNIYSFGKTEYNRFINKPSDQHSLHGYEGDTVSLPLIPLDLENPHKTLERIKTLVLFS